MPEKRDYMGKKAFLAVVILVCAGVVCFGQILDLKLQYEFGGIGGGGAEFAWGSHFDNKAAQLAALGASSFTTAGTSQMDLFLGWTAGAYGDVYFFPWLGVRVEPRLSLQGGSYLALNDATPPLAFDRYGAYFYSLIVPVYARGRLPIGPGFATISLGGFYGIAVSEIMMSDQYAAVLTTSSFVPESPQGQLLGLSGGLGYSLVIGRIVAAVELRADWNIIPVTGDNSIGEIWPLQALLAASVGYSLDGSGL
jgi:hypothetical protein